MSAVATTGINRNRLMCTVLIILLHATIHGVSCQKASAVALAWPLAVLSCAGLTNLIFDQQSEAVAGAVI